MRMRILDNLENRVYPVSLLTALTGVPLNEGYQVLRELAGERKVQFVQKRGGPQMVQVVPDLLGATAKADLKAAGSDGLTRYQSFCQSA